MDLKQTQKILLVNFWLMLVLALLIVALYECELIGRTDLDGNAQLVFLFQVVMEMATIICIPLALKLFSIKKIRQKLINGKSATLLPWGTARINMLCIPMIVNTFLYYQTMSPAFGYMAIILLLCLFFIYPSLSRCYAETEEEDNVKDKEVGNHK